MGHGETGGQRAGADTRAQRGRGRAVAPRERTERPTLIPQDIANLLWAMAKLVDNGQEQTPELKEAVAALLPHVNAQKDQL